MRSPVAMHACRRCPDVFCLIQAASVFTTAIVTGRSKDKVYNFVGLDDVFYAGSHGLEIQGPLERPVRCQVCLQLMRPIYGIVLMSSSVTR